MDWSCHNQASRKDVTISEELLKTTENGKKKFKGATTIFAYGIECWTIFSQTKGRIEASEIQLY